MEKRRKLVEQFELRSRLPEAAEHIFSMRTPAAPDPNVIEFGLKEVELYMASATECVLEFSRISTDGIYGRTPIGVSYQLLLSQQYIGFKISAEADGRERARELIALIRTQLRLRKELLSCQVMS